MDGRFDQNTIIADPMFVNAADRDFRLRPGSQALAVGFEQIEVSEIGLKQDFPPRLSESIEEEYRIPPGLLFHPGG